VVNAKSVPVESEVCLAGGDDDQNQSDESDTDGEWTHKEGEWLGPADVWVTRSHKPLRKKEIDDVENDCSSGDENLCSDSQIDALGIVRPRNAQGS